MAAPYTLSVVRDVAASSSENIIEGQSGETLGERSRVMIALNREDVNITFDVFIGGERVMVNGGAAINATVGDIPILPDDIIIDSFGKSGDKIVIRATNAEAALNEARAVVKITPIDDVILQEAMDRASALGALEL